MADGSVKIDITADDSDIKKKLDETEEGLNSLGDKQKETQKETEKTTTKFEELAESIAKQEKELGNLKGEYTQAIINFGKGSAEAQALEEKMSALNTELSENKKTFSYAASEAEKLSSALEQNEKSFGVADVAVGNFISDGVTELIGKVGEAVSSLIALADETREYREDMSKLEAGFKSVGHSTETAKMAYDGFYRILGESDRSVEAVNHLAELTNNTEDVAKWTDIAAGVTAKFGDSLPIEGLTEAANETAKVGAVTGPLADALNWAGISEDAFNEKLAACNSEQERATLITNTLSTEYQAAAAEYNTLTASTQAARDATNEMEQAQAALGAAIEPLTTAWTNMKATALNWLAEGLTPIIEKTTGLRQETDILTQSNLSHVVAAQKEAAAYRDTIKAASELAAQQMADVDYATNSLLPQLQALVDSNGKIKKGYEERAAFIMGQLNEAYGTEYTRIGEIVGKNGELTQSIQGAINAKKAQILLAAHEENYIEAVQKKAEAERAYYDLMGEIVNRTAEVEKKEEELESLRKEQSAAFQARNSVEGNALKRKADQLEISVNEEKVGIDELIERYNESASNYELYSTRISDYDTAKTLILEGNTEEAISYLNNLQTTHDETASAAEEADNKELASLENKLKNSAVKLALIKEEHAKNYKGMTAEQQKEIDARLAAAEKEVEDLGTEAEKLGSNLVEGIGVGADGKKDWLSGKLGGIVSAAITAAKKIGLIASPSKKTRDEVGKPLAQGVGVGIEKEKGVAIDAAENMMQEVVETFADADGKKEAVNKATAFSDKIASVLEDAANEEKDSVIAHANEMKRINKQHNDDLWEENHQHGLRMQGLKEEHNEKLAALDEKKESINAEYVKADEAYIEKLAALDEREESIHKEYEKAGEAFNEKIATLDENWESISNERIKAEKAYKEKKEELAKKDGTTEADYAKAKEEFNEKIAELHKKRSKLEADYAKVEQDKADKKEELAKKEEALEADRIKAEKENAEKIADIDKKKLSNEADYVNAEKELHKKEQDEIAKHNEAVIKLNNERDTALQKEFAAKQDIIRAQMQVLLDHDAEYAEKSKSIWTTLDENVSSLMDNYQTNLENRAKSIANSMNLFEEVSLDKVRGMDLRIALRSQVKVLEAYNEDIDNLSNRGILSTEMLDSIKKMGVDAAAEVKAISQMTDKELTDYAKLWEEKNKLAMEAATEEMETEKEGMLAEIETLKTEAVGEYMKLREEYQTQGALLAEELKQSMIDAGDGGYEELIGQVDDYKAAGASLMDGVISGIEFKTNDVASAFKAALRAAVNAGEDDMEIASPSKVTKREIGYNLADGVVTGWNERITAARDLMAEKMGGLVTRIKATVSAEQSKMAQGVGTRDFGFTEVARAVGMQTAGINSLASEYRKGSSAQVTVPLILDGREVGRAFVDLGNAESVRVGTDLSFA